MAVRELSNGRGDPPLAVTQTLLDVARQDPTHDSAELLERLRVVNARAIDLTEALLVLSRADQRAFIREPVDLSLLAEDAVETLLPLAEKRGVTLEVSGDLAWANGSRGLLLQMVTNLVHNAIVHNLPEQGRVRVATTSSPAGATLIVTLEGFGQGRHELGGQLITRVLLAPNASGAPTTRAWALASPS